MPDHKPLWCVLRVVDYNLAFLEFPDIYAPLGTSTWLTHDREEAYLKAREQRGLLCKWSGLPDASTLNHVATLVDHCFYSEATVDA